MAYTTHDTVRFEAEDARLFRLDFARGSRLGAEPGGQRIIRYDTARFPFERHIRRLLVAKGMLSAAAEAGLAGLDQLHHVLAKADQELDAAELNEASRRFYDTDAGFLATYESFLKQVAGEAVACGDFVFQSTPTIRFHFPQQAGFDWKPRFHTDIMLGHPPQEINLWLPLCGAVGSATMRIADLAPSLAVLDDLELDFQRLAGAMQTDAALAARCMAISRPVEMPYGEFLAFDPRCLHATQHNDTGRTRVSLDFRIVPLGDYEAMRLPYRGTGRRQMLFRRGHYFDQRTSREL
jgi:hypothetical protein